MVEYLKYVHQPEPPWVNKISITHSQRLFNETSANSSAGRRLEHATSSEPKINGILETLPLFKGEEFAESRIAKGNGLIWAKGLSCIGI